MQVIASLPKPPGFFDPDRHSGLSARRLQEIEEELATANGQAPETPTEDEEEEEDSGISANATFFVELDIDTK